LSPRGQQRCTFFRRLSTGATLLSVPSRPYKGVESAECPYWSGRLPNYQRKARLTATRSNTDEGSNWSATLPTVANTSAPGADETTVYEFIRGQYPDLRRVSFDGALTGYPLDDYDGNVALQGQQMYGEERYICTASLMASALTGLGVNAWQYRQVESKFLHIR